LGSSLSSFRSRTCTSGVISGDKLALLSAAAVCPSSSFSFSLPLFVILSVFSAFSFGRGVLDRLGCSSSSPMTNSGSNSEGSGPFPVGNALPPFSTSFDLPVLLEGDWFRVLFLLAGAPDRDGEADALCLAVSSAIRASSAPLMRFAITVSFAT
jgi:hypothetical protein